MTTETVTALPFQGVLKLGSRGTQPVAVKRGLWHAGFHEGWKTLGDQAISQEILGGVAVENLRHFQRYHGLKHDGVYGEATHKVLRGSFDPYAERLYMAPPHVELQLPSAFTATHQTAGLPGYPAIDNFAPAGSTVGAPEAGTITRFSGHDPKEGGQPGGAYGWSMYLTCPSAIYYFTHFGSRAVTLGQKVKRGEMLGTVCDARVVGSPTSTSHIHEGKHEL